MNDPITQMRLSTRLERYLSDYTKKAIGRDSLSSKEWNTVWHVADVARIQSTLTPELVDDVRKALNNFC